MKPLLALVADRTALVGVGYVGLPLALVFQEAGFRVVGFDVDPVKVDAVKRGESYIKHIGPERVAAAVASGRYTATTELDRLTECDAVLICVPTPLGRHREPDNSFTAHDAFKDPGLYRGVKLVVDSRNAVAPLFAGHGGGPRVVMA